MTGHTEGEAWGRDGCPGTIVLRPAENCSCHIAPPCSSCVERLHHCPVCDWLEDQNFGLNDYIVKVDTRTGVYRSWELRPLDPTKIDWHSKSHTHFSMIKEGVYPPGTTQAQVLERVQGTFGGRFEYFDGGRFKYIAYTD